MTRLPDSYALFTSAHFMLTTLHNNRALRANDAAFTLLTFDNKYAAFLQIPDSRRKNLLTRALTYCSIIVNTYGNWFILTSTLLRGYARDDIATFLSRITASRSNFHMPTTIHQRNYRLRSVLF